MEQNVFVETATSEWDGVFNQISFDQVKKGSDPYCFSSVEQRVVPYSHKREEGIRPISNFTKLVIREANFTKLVIREDNFQFHKVGHTCGHMS
ncbi:hypothetical protein Glove_319g55 [Diversispora epigaea]|uniref:Uncharacterized protein n=1 Tax=Diversispora epigaea TaxID=1348612 RepID=A0A397HPS8_9GLOM|nr:hypothetical protein Glove_319g55 [Diversispora epigaea]